MWGKNIPLQNPARNRREKNLVRTGHRASAQFSGCRDCQTLAAGVQKPLQRGQATVWRKTAALTHQTLLAMKMRKCGIQTVGEEKNNRRETKEEWSSIFFEPRADQSKYDEPGDRGAKHFERRHAPMAQVPIAKTWQEK